MSAPVDVLAVMELQSYRLRASRLTRELRDCADRELREARAAVAELIAADQRAICRMERALEAAAGLNKLLPEAQPVRDLLSTVVGQTSLAIEAKRAALARVQGGAA